MKSAERDADLLDLILELIGLVSSRVRARAYADIEGDRNEIDLAAFRLGHIGEAARQLSSELKDRYPHIRWRQMYGMRNVLAHECPAVRPELLWRAATEDMKPLEAVCRADMDRLGG